MEPRQANRWRAFAAGLGAAAVLIGIAAGALIFSVAWRGVSARATPSAPETFIARRLRHLAVPTGARELGNPLAGSQAAVKAGMEHFADHCAVCHANDGSGRTMIGQGLYPKPPDLRLPTTQSLSDGELFYIIQNGVRLTGMPAWGSDDADDATDNWRLVAFIRHLPDLTPGELAEMQQLNPKSAAERRQERAIEEFLNGGDKK